MRNELTVDKDSEQFEERIMAIGKRPDAETLAKWKRNAKIFLGLNRCCYCIGVIVFLANFFSHGRHYDAGLLAGAVLGLVSYGVSRMILWAIKGFMV